MCSGVGSLGEKTRITIKSILYRIIRFVTTLIITWMITQSIWEANILSIINMIAAAISYWIFDYIYEKIRCRSDKNDKTSNNRKRGDRKTDC